MTIHNTPNSYGWVTKLFHWTIAALVIGMLVFGYFLDDFTKEWQQVVYNTHKLIGVTILLLMVLRLCWALANAKPALPANTPSWQRSAEVVGHMLLYFFVMLMPLAGWVGASASGRPPHLWDIQLQLPVAQNKALADAAFELHGTVAIILIGLVSVHVLAALFHHYIKKDDILKRMMP